MPSLNKDIQSHIWDIILHKSSDLTPVHTWSKRSAQGLQMSSLIILSGLCGYVWVSILTLFASKGSQNKRIHFKCSYGPVFIHFIKHKYVLRSTYWAADARTQAFHWKRTTDRIYDSSSLPVLGIQHWNTMYPLKYRTVDTPIIGLNIFIHAEKDQAWHRTWQEPSPKRTIYKGTHSHRQSQVTHSCIWSKASMHMLQDCSRVHKDVEVLLKCAYIVEVCIFVVSWQKTHSYTFWLFFM